LLRNPEGGYVCRKDGQIIGTVLAGWDGFRGSIFHLAVLEAYRGLGIGSRLLQTAESYLKDLGVFQINLMVREGNDLAESLYYRRGYERSPVKVLRKRFSEEQLLQLAGK
jgi:ribosomal protein S18 acetylase RimI-like enzyme